jgi:hypothetical protein
MDVRVSMTTRAVGIFDAQGLVQKEFIPEERAL